MGRLFIPIICIGVVVCGGVNSLMTKYQDNQCVRDCQGASPVYFNQPVLQTLQMFIGETSMLVLWWFQLRSKDRPQLEFDNKPSIRGRAYILLALPAICDIIATTLMNLALVMIPVSIYQMVRGAIVFFVALFSVLFLGRKVSRLEWAYLATIVAGVAVVGYSGQSVDAVSEPMFSSSLLIGVFLILFALLFMATQFIIEEHVMSRWAVNPVGLIGHEGLFGSSITVALLLVGNYMGGYKNANSAFNLKQAFSDMFARPAVLNSSFVIMVSIALFNFFGVSITKNVSATSRSTVDTCRTLLVWCISLALGWESFKFTQLCGFALLVIGTLLFNNAIAIPDKYLPSYFLEDKSEESERLINTIDEEVERF
ncbi:LAQU0S12e01068g1_1 [Lachancea quebecensis]|uniref:LAQU0S12e01068g1_1 n=1 Tax=Lachancea quebecensis TaxID=1654605 RepID=A0A0P1KVL9_9SACH|nr:LAQU0S12e01068g1_1 [Lachancea quebecensis]